MKKAIKMNERLSNILKKSVVNPKLLIEFFSEL